MAVIYFAGAIENVQAGKHLGRFIVAAFSLLWGGSYGFKLKPIAGGAAGDTRAGC